MCVCDKNDFVVTQNFIKIGFKRLVINLAEPAEKQRLSLKQNINVELVSNGTAESYTISFTFET
jgi:hypothetical protein